MRRCRSPSTSIASRCCAVRRAHCSAPVPKAAPCVTSPRSRASTKTSVYGRSEVSSTEGGDAELRGGHRGRRPAASRTSSARARRSGTAATAAGSIDIDPVTLAADAEQCQPRRHVPGPAGRALWAPNENWTVTPSSTTRTGSATTSTNYWPLYSNPNNNRFVGRRPTAAPRCPTSSTCRPSRSRAISARCSSSPTPPTTIARNRPATTARSTTSASTRRICSPPTSAALLRGCASAARRQRHPLPGRGEQLPVARDH